ncbi:MAG: Asp-tRNA(Asn)/Glu-tRNA(Gln) amidotransferase subunit GatA [Opitutales bacterium]|nr:Asp-tRNA(Asn)/Glu-tRNA(Gln) amidotransferase subunit GatA [Opitutales bacterium]
MSESLFYKSATELSSLLQSGALSSVELTRAFIERTQAVEPSVKAFLQQNVEEALAMASESDFRRSRGQSLGPLDGIPVAIKDVISVKGASLSCGSRMLSHFVSPYDAHAAELLKAAGAVLWGRLNMDEFAMGSSTENSAFQTTSNPWNTDCIPGGSSGGSAAAVAAGESPLTLGTDTGGSIRQPAALCGVVGLKPTYGLVSRYGMVAYASSLEQIGPFGRTVADVAMLLQAIAGHDRRDSTSYKVDIPDYTAALQAPAKKWRLGIPKEYFAEGLDPEVRQAVRNAIEFYRAQGCEIVDVSLPHAELAIPVYYIIATAEASSNLARFDGVRYSYRSPNATDVVSLYSKSRGEGFGSEVKRRIILGTYVLSSGYYDAYYLRAQKVRTLIRDDFMKAYEQVDAILTPTSPTPAFKLGERKEDPLSMYLADIYTISANLAGIPGISIPCGFSSENLPLGLQILGKPYDEAGIMAVAHAFEQAHDFHKRYPSL